MGGEARRGEGTPGGGWRKEDRASRYLAGRARVPSRPNSQPRRPSLALERRCSAAPSSLTPDSRPTLTPAHPPTLTLLSDSHLWLSHTLRFRPSGPPPSTPLGRSSAVNHPRSPSHPLSHPMIVPRSPSGFLSGSFFPSSLFFSPPSLLHSLAVAPSLAALSIHLSLSLTLSHPRLFYLAVFFSSSISLAPSVPRSVRLCSRCPRLIGTRGGDSRLFTVP